MHRTLGVGYILLLACSSPSTDHSLSSPPKNQTSNPQTGAQSSSSSRVANPDTRNFSQQPDYQAQAIALREQVQNRLAKQLLLDRKTACDAMFQAVDAFYQQVERDDDLRKQTLANLQSTRSQDLAQCQQTTSPEAAACVTILLGDQNAEFPWLLDQCSRAFPTKNEPASKIDAFEITFVGDIIFGRYRQDGYDPIPDPGYQPFADIAPKLKADVIVGNLETPLVRELPQKSPIGALYRFGASAQMASLLAEAGFTALSLANNHAFDMREQGMLETPQILEELGIIPLGKASTDPDSIFRIDSVPYREWNIGFLAVTTRRNAPHREGAPSLPFLSTNDLVQTLGPLLDQAKHEYAPIIVFIHWGDEYADAPARVQQSQARALIDRGAHLVVGHHPHVLQGIERYRHGLIAYSLGNFLFENTHEIPRLTGVLRVKFSGKENTCLEQVVFHPAYIERKPTKHPVPATGTMGIRVRQRMVNLSKNLETTLTQEGEDLLVEGVSCPP